MSVDLIKQIREALSNSDINISTIGTYVSALANLCRRMNVASSPLTCFRDRDNCDLIIRFIKTHPAYQHLGYRNILYSALYKISNFPIYAEQVAVLRPIIHNNALTQQQLPSRQGKEITQEQIASIHHKHLARFHSITGNGIEKTHAATDAMISGLMSGAYANQGCPPRRLLE